MSKPLKFRPDRVLEMAAYLEELPANRFDITSVCVPADWKLQQIEDLDKRAEAIKCGMVGCIGGHTPQVFPKLVRYSGDYLQGHETHRPLMVKIAPGCWKPGSFEDVCEPVFGIPMVVGSNLFLPEKQRRVHKSLPVLSLGSRPSTAAKMLRAFASLVCSGELNLEETRQRIAKIA